MIRSAAALGLLALLAACGGAPGAPSGAARSVSLPGGGTCLDPDPARDGPLVDAIRRGDAASVQARLATAPGDARAAAALRVISSGPRPDPDQAACFAPYLSTD